MTTPTHDELRRLTARMLDDEAIGEHDRSRLLAYIANAEQAERELAIRTTEFTQLSDSFIALQNEHAEAMRELATLRPLAAVVREHGFVILEALEVAADADEVDEIEENASSNMAEAAKALAGVLGK